MADKPELEKRHEHSTAEELTADRSSIFSRLGGLTVDPETVLHEHQVDALQAVIEFYRNGGEIGYVDLPTGTGKTVLFVEICKQLAQAEKVEGKTGKSIILVPSIDLVTQTVGSIDPETGKKRGFKGFAPELDVRPIHGKISHQDRVDGLQADVLVTTYNSFRNIVDMLQDVEGADAEELRQLAREKEHELVELVAERERLVQQRQDEFYPLYLDQSVKSFRRRLASMMSVLDNAQDVVYEDEDGDEDIVEAVVEETPEAPLSEADQKELRRKQLQPHTENIRMLYELASAEGPAEETIRRLLKHTRKLAPFVRLGPKFTKVDLDGKKVEVEHSDEERLGLKGLDPHSRLLVGFNHKFRQGRRNLTRSDLQSYKLAERWSTWDERIGRASDRMTYARSIAKKYAYQATLVEYMEGYELLVCDEAHRAVGDRTWDSIKEYALGHDLSVLGLTATDKFFDRTLQDYFGKRIHSLSRLEAMEMGLISPLALFEHNTGRTFDDIDLDASGDYDPETMIGVIHDRSRNAQGAQYAAMLTAAGINGVMSTIPGRGGEHARLMEDELNSTETSDPLTGERRMLRAQHVLGTMPPELRAKYYAQFEKGEIDWLVFIDVLREGWDSDRAKALINLRSTRSPLLATQRLGRIGRVDESNPLSVVIDFYDEFHRSNSVLNVPPVLATDVFHVDGVEQGHVIGVIPDQIPAVIAELSEKMPGTLKARHIEFMRQYESAVPVDAYGRSYEGSDREKWLSEGAIDSAFGGFMPMRIVRDEVAARTDLRVKLGRSKSGRVMELYNSADLALLHADKPEINPWKSVVDDHDVKWVAPEACVKLLEKLHASLEDIKYAVSRVEEQGVDYRVGRVRLSFADGDNQRFGLVQLFRLSDIVEKVVPLLRSTKEV